jgi:cell division protein ZapA
MIKRPQPVVVTILGKEYRIVCEESEKQGLFDTAKELDQQMREIRDSGGINSPDRIAVMAALNLAHELRQVQHVGDAPLGGFAEKLVRLRHKIENVLENS